jgi:hypothetical protein
MALFEALTAVKEVVVVAASVPAVAGFLGCYEDDEDEENFDDQAR